MRHEWVDDAGQMIPIDAKVLEEWRFVGLSNHSFVEFVIDGDFPGVVVYRSPA